MNMKPHTDRGAALSPTHQGRDIAQLTDEQRQSFKRNGFLVIENALSNTEVTHYRAIMAALDQTAVRNEGGKADDVARKPGDYLELRNCVTWHDDLLNLLVHPTTFPLVVELMSPHITMTTSHALIRPPSPKGTDISAKQICWHRDGPGPGSHAVNGGLPWLYTKIGYFLTDLTIPDAGALRVVPGSHRYEGPAPQQTGHWEPYGVHDRLVRPLRMGSDVLELGNVVALRPPVAIQRPHLGDVFRPDVHQSGPERCAQPFVQAGAVIVAV